MVAFEPQSQPERQGTPPQNVRGWERLLSIGGGLLLATLGASKNGERGRRQLSVGGLLLLRGLSGHCSVKSAVDDPLAEIHYLRARVQRLQELLLMAEEVANRTRATAVPPMPPAPVAPATADLGMPIAEEVANPGQSR